MLFQFISIQIPQYDTRITQMFKKLVFWVYMLTEIFKLDLATAVLGTTFDSSQVLC